MEQVVQISDRATSIWCNEVDFLIEPPDTFWVSGTYYHAGVPYAVYGSGTVPSNRPFRENHLFYIGSGGVLYVDPPPLPPGSLWAFLGSVMVPSGSCLGSGTAQRTWQVSR